MAVDVEDDRLEKPIMMTHEMDGRDEGYNKVEGSK